MSDAARIGGALALIAATARIGGAGLLLALIVGTLIAGEDR